MNVKTFFDLKQEIQATGKCHGCGGCVTFCKAINYGALEMGENNIPRYQSVEKCIDCGLCYRICPAVNDGEEELQRHFHWSEPAGRIQAVHSVRIRDSYIRSRATDGGAVTGILLHLFDKGHIEGAIVTHQENGGRKPFLATTRDEIIRSAGTAFDLPTGGMSELGTGYSSYSPSIQAMGDLLRVGLRRIAFIGTPCQIKSIRKMQLLRIAPADAVHFCFGLFCSANYDINPQALATFPMLAGRALTDVTKANIKENFLLHFGQEKVEIPLAEMMRFRRPACGHCHEFSAEYADISFGGVGSPDGWTTVLTRTPLGRAVFADSLGATLEAMSIDEHKGCTARALSAVLDCSTKKRMAVEGSVVV